ncbi:Uncharacterised protein [Serratia quinivorans]|nr:Uncharacterised protein [Serratia quinivorans]
MAASCRKVACTTQEALTRDEDGLIADYWVQKERQRFGNYPAMIVKSYSRMTWVTR